MTARRRASSSKPREATSSGPRWAVVGDVAVVTLGTAPGVIGADGAYRGGVARLDHARIRGLAAEGCTPTAIAREIGGELVGATEQPVLQFGDDPAAIARRLLEIAALLVLPRGERGGAVRRGGAVEVPYGVAIAIAGLLSLREPLLNQFT